MDTVAPGAQEESGPTEPTNAKRPVFGWVESGGASSRRCSIGTGTASYGSCSGVSTHQPSSDLSDGSYTFRVEVSDAAGNKAYATRSFSVDTVSPVVSVDAGPSGATSEQSPPSSFLRMSLPLSLPARQLVAKGL